LLMILCNLNPANSIYNSICAIFIYASDHILKIWLIEGKFAGKLVFIPCITCTAREANTRIPFELQYWQFPVGLTFMITINKAQGQLVKQVGLDLCVL
ncbi:hypothetical protein OBBRIDRAFT_731381, partial [Obba rivulosa]